MRKLTKAAIITTILLSGIVHANDPIDNKVKAALYEIERAEQQINGASAGQSSKLNRISRMLESANAQLVNSTNQAHASWINAKQRADALAANMAQLQSPIQANPSTANQPSTADIALIGTIDRQTDGFIRQLNEYDQFDFVRLSTQLGDRIEELKRQYAGLKNPEHAMAIVVAQKVLSVEEHIRNTIASQTALENSLGDIESMVAEIQQRHKRKHASESRIPDAPYSHEEVMSFTQRLKARKAMSEQDLAYLQKIEGKTQRVNVHHLVVLVRASIDSVEQERDLVAQRIEDRLRGFDQIDSIIDRVATHQIEGRITELQHALSLLDLSDGFNTEMELAPKPTQQRRYKYEQAINTLHQKAESAITDARFPEIRSTNPELLAAAEEVLSRKQYSVNPIVRMGITYDIQRKHTAEGDIDWGAAATTVTVTGYEWDEFAVTTVEEINGNYHLFYNLFKYFHAGGTDVPVGKWTLGERRQGIRIQEANVDS